MPDGWPPGPAGVESFCRLLLDACVGHASAVKANLAFFEAWGSQGLAVLERVRAALPSDLPFIADAKRGDIRSTSARHSVALFDSLGADAVTVSPYLGGAAIEPLLERTDRFAYVLCRTSDPGSGELQDLAVTAPPDGEEVPIPLYLRVSRRAAAWDAGRGTVGLVVGATGPAELTLVRQNAPGLAFLVPGIGRQGGDVGATLDSGPARDGPAARRPGGGLLVNLSRSISSAAVGAADPAKALEEVARSWAARLRV